MNEKLRTSEFEFNPDDYPERISCRTRFTFEYEYDDKNCAIEVTTIEGEPALVAVPRAAIIPIPMPHLAENAPAVIRQVFEDRTDESMTVAIPSGGESVILTVAPKILVRRVE